MARSILAIVVGFLVIGVLSIGTDTLLHQLAPGAFNATGGSDNLTVLIGSQVYVGIFATFGCWLTARLAPSRPMRHALILGVLGLAFNVAGTATNWSAVPAWYNVVSLSLVMPYALFGGWLRERQLVVK